MASIGDEQTPLSIFKFHGGFDRPPCPFVPDDATGRLIQEAALPNLAHQRSKPHWFRDVPFPSVMNDANCLDPAPTKSFSAVGWLTRREVSPQDTPSMVFTCAANSPLSATVAEPTRIGKESDPGFAGFCAWEREERASQARVIEAIERRTDTPSNNSIFRDCALFRRRSPGVCLDFPIGKQLTGNRK
jgi:hypothetical protein